VYIVVCALIWKHLTIIINLNHVVHLTGGRLFRNVYDWRSEEVLQRHEKTGFQAATETDTETKGMLLFSCF